MTVLLVLATVVVFLLIDHFYSRRAEVREAPAERKPAPLEAPAAQVTDCLADNACVAARHIT